MNFEKYLDVINACRFCFMCRHLATLAVVTAKEADTPRGHALIADRIRMNPAELAKPDFIATLYQADLSGACRTHCVSSYDETGLVLALRADIAAAGLAPQPVQDLTREFTHAQFTVDPGDSDLLYYPHPCVELHQPEIAAAFQKLAPAARTVSGGDCGKVLGILGFTPESEAVAARFRKAILAANAKTLVVSSPAAYDFLKTSCDLPGIDVKLTSEYLLEQPLGIAAVTGKAAFIDSDFLRRYQTNDAPRRLLASLGVTATPFGTNSEESYACGEGSMPIIRLYPALVAKMAGRVAELAERHGVETIITPSPYTKYALKLFAPQVNVMALEEVAASARPMNRT